MTVGSSPRDHGLSRIPAGARADLLRVLTSPSNLRADVIRQFHERGDDGMVEVLTVLEADELMRLQVTLALREMTLND
jgi:hypothetical protein